MKSPEESACYRSPICIEGEMTVVPRSGNEDPSLLIAKIEQGNGNRENDSEKVSKVRTAMRKMFSMVPPFVFRLDTYRWAIQAGLSSALAAFFLTFLEPTRSFFGRSGIIGAVNAIICTDVTAGASTRKALLYCMLGLIGALTAGAILFIALLPASFLGSKDFSSALIYIFSVLSPLLPMAVRYWTPRLTIATNFMLSNMLAVLLSSYSGHSGWSLVLRRALACVVGNVSVILITCTVLRKPAKHTAVNSLATVFGSLSKMVSSLVTVDALKSGAPEQSNMSLALQPIFIYSSYNILSTIKVSYSFHGTPSSDLPHEGDDWVKFSQSTDNFYKKTNGPKSSHSGNMGSQPSNAQFMEENRKKSENNYYQTTEVKKLLYSVQKDKQLYLEMLQEIAQCQRLLAGQPALIDAATHEISCKKPHRFPKQIYEAMVNEVQRLFFHISSLVIAVYLFLSTLEKAASLLEKDPKAPHNQVEHADKHAYSQPNANNHQNQPSSSYQAEPPRQMGYGLDALELQQNIKPSPNQPLNGIPPTVSKAEARQVELLVQIATYISEVLQLMSVCVRNGEKTCSEIQEKIMLTSEAIKELDKQRNLQREKFAEIIHVTLEADVTAKWTRNQNLPFSWLEAIGMEIKDYMKLSEFERIQYCNSYWSRRDQLSHSCTILNYLKTSLVKTAVVIDTYAAYLNGTVPC